MQIIFRKFLETVSFVKFLKPLTNCSARNHRKTGLQKPAVLYIFINSEYTQKHVFR